MRLAATPSWRGYFLVGFLAIQPPAWSAPTPAPIRMPAHPPATARVGLPALVVEAGPAAIMMHAKWSYPSRAMHGLLLEIASPSMHVVFLDVDEPRDAAAIKALGGAPVVPTTILVDANRVIWKRYFGWPAPNPSGARAVLRKDVDVLTRR